MKRKKILAAGIALALLVGGCGSTGGASVQEAESSQTSAAAEKSEETEAKEDLDYEYGETFHSETPVSYTMFWSDHEAYPLTDSWQIFDAIEEITNVKLDIADYMIARTDYDQKKALMINSGQSAYIIPKTYDESAFVDGGAVVAVSDWVQYMPNYTNFVEKYNLADDIATIEREGGKYYRLPGLHEVALQDYTFIVRDDIFKAAGIDVASMEKEWTWNDLYDVLTKVKAYMVSEGMCSESDYIWSDRWAGGNTSGGNLLKLMGASFDVNAGWAIEDGMRFDHEKGEWYFSPVSDNAKEFLKTATKFVKDGLLDPETFIQDDEQATQKFYRGDTVILGSSKGAYAEYVDNLNATLGKGNYELYQVVCPMGTTSNQAENVRLENGVMIAQKALDELGEEEFIKMLRFVDWLFYSDQAKDLVKWGVEGKTYEYVTDESGNKVKKLLPEWYGLNSPKQSEDQKGFSIDTGFSGGVFCYGGTFEQDTDAFIPELIDYFDRASEYRTTAKPEPALPSTEDENEQINLWKTPLVDNVNSWYLNFITGKADIDAQWEEYVKSCETLNSVKLTELFNEIYKRSLSE